MSEQAHNRTEAAIRFRDEITKLLGLIEFLWTNFSVLDVVAKGFAQFLIQLHRERGRRRRGHSSERPCAMPMPRERSEW